MELCGLWSQLDCSCCPAPPAGHAPGVLVAVYAVHAVGAAVRGVHPKARPRPLLALVSVLPVLPATIIAPVLAAPPLLLLL